MLYYCCGLPRSGKSTFCNRWASEKPNRVIVRADDIRLALHGKRFEALAEVMVEAIKLTTIRAQILRGADVLVDGTHTTESSIKKLLEIDPNAIAVPIITPIELCKQRAIKTQQEDLLPVIDRMNSQLTKLLESDFYIYLNKVDMTNKTQFEMFYYG